MVLILTLGTMYVVSYQNVSAAEIVSSTTVISYTSTYIPDLTDNDRFGSSIANIGDQNGDGISDIMVGAPYDDATGTDTGTIHVIFMNSNGTASYVVEINDYSTNGPIVNDYDLFGSSIANIGDLNNDGVTDIAVGAHSDDMAGDDSGTVHVMFMNSSGRILGTIEINNDTTNGPVLTTRDNFGYSIANIGDLNGDGTSDIAVGTVGDDASGNDSGAIYVMFMNSNGTVSNSIKINGNTTNGPDLSINDRFGSSVANIGDLNNDGVSDIAVGAFSDDAGGSSRGAVHILFMNSNGTVSRTMEINSNTPNGPNLGNGDLFGYSIANIGDWNNDGTSDIVVGALSDNAGGTVSGAVHIILLNSNGTVSNSIKINGNTANGPNLSTNDYFASSVANIGDLDGNNVMDIAAGAPRTDAGGSNRGAIHIIFMNPDDTVPPTFSSATLDKGTGNLTITFNEKVNVHTINFTGLSIRDGAGTDIITPSITELVTTINDMSISFNMTLPNRQSLIAFTSYVLDIDAGTVYDLVGHAIIASSDNPITAIPDTAPPILSFTSITPNNGTQSIGDDIIIQITTNTYEAGLTLLNATINNATPTFSEWVLPSGPDYNYRKTITINNAMVSGSADHTDFPLLVSIQNDPSLNSVAVQASGQDIRFTTIDDTLIDYEITSFSNNHTSGSLSAWVKIPTLSASTDTQIYMYYSNPIVADGQNVTAVWDSDYVGVWHYDGDILDSTGNNNDGTNYDSIETTGIIGGGRSFDGNDYISYDDSIFPSGSSPRTLSAWVNHSNLLTTVQALLVYGTGDTGQAYGLFQKDSKWLAGGYSDDITLNTTPTINNWYHLTMTYDGTTVRAYVDGSLDISAAKSWNTILDEFRVGQQLNTGNQFFAGQIDEIRISDTVKTADWIKTEYDNQNSDSFYSVSVQQELVTPVYYNLTYNVAEGDSDIDDTTEGITYSITLSDAVGNPSVPLTATLPSISSPGVDANSPIITLNGTNPQTIEFGDGYTELGATTNDGSQVTIDTANFTDSVGTYTIYYNSMDAAGNNATQINRTVNVVNILPPVITLNGTNPQIIEFGDGYTELGATTNDGSPVTINTDEFRDAVGTYTIYYDSTDALGNNAAQVNRTVNVVNILPPVITLNGTNPQIIELGDGYTELGATTNDDSPVTINSANFTDSIGTYTIYYDSTDVLGNNATQVNRTVNVVNILPPVITLNGTNPQIIEFGDGYTELGATTNDGSPVTINSANFTDFVGTHFIYYDSTDTAGNNATQVIRTVNVVDTIPPVITLNGTNPQTIEFGDGYTELGATTNDGSPVTIDTANFTDSVGTYTIYYNSMDASGNNATQVNRTVNVVNILPPVITLNGTNPQTIEFGDGYTELGATTNDGSPVTINSANFTDSVGTYTIYYDSTDALGNNATQVNRTVNVVNILPPVITLNGTNPQTIEFGDGYTELGATTDDGSPVTINSANFTDSVGTYFIYYDSTDTAGNNATQVNRTVNVVDTTPPVITLNGTNPQIIEFGDGYTELGATTNDGSPVTINSANFTDFVGTHFIYYDSTDTAGNNATQVIRTVNVVDTIPPVITLNGTNPQTIEFGDGYTELGATTNDGSPVTIDTANFTDSVGTYTIYYNSMDASGNNATQVNRTVNVVNILPPVITLNGTNPQTIEFGDGYTELGATTNDGSPVTINSANFTDSVGTYTIYYDSTDTLGNNATQVNRTVNVVDTTPPVITLNGTNPQTIEFGDGYTELGATTNDGSQVTIDTANFTDSVGTYFIYYDSMDAFNNNATQVNRTVNVVDTTPPVITLNGTNPQTIEFGDGYTELGATTNDGSPVTINTANFTDSVGTYTIYYNSMDASGNNATQVNRTVNVVNILPPVISLNGTNPQIIELGDGYTELGATTNDGSPVTINFANFTDSIGTYTIYYDSTDVLGNNATQVNRTVNVVNILPPVITLNGTNPQIIEFGDGYTELGATTDDGSQVTINTANFTDSVGTYFIYYDSTDTAGNNATQVNRTVNVVDTTPPVITLNGTNPQTIEFGDGYTELGATTNDGSQVTINTANFTDSVGTYFIYYDSMDAFNNNATQVNRTVNVVDTIPPVITLNGTNPQTIEFGDGYTELGATTNDGSPVTINTANFTDSVGTYTIYYNSMDASGNNATQVNRTVNVVNILPPVISLNGTNPQIIELGDGYTELGATTNDDSPVTINFANFTDSIGTYTIYYDSTDVLGNNATQVNRTVNVVNILPPVITLNGTNPQIIEFGDGYTELGATTDDGSPVTINSANFTDFVGTYFIYYDSTDTAGNNATQVNRTVNVVDTTPPVITLNGTNPQIIEFGDGYTELGATTNDGSQVTINTDEFRDAVGTYSIYYDSMDAFNNNATQVNRTVNVVDSIPPVITLNGTNPQTIEFGDGYTELGATTSDGSQVTINTDEFRDAVGTYSIYYDSMDASGNNATQINRTVNVVNILPPVITLNGANPQTIEFGDGYTELGATTDDGSQVTIDTANFTDSVGTYFIYYDSTDTAGNNATQVIRTVNVVDTIPPVITLNGANPQIIKLGDGYTELGATTNDGSPVTVNSGKFIDEVCSYSIYYNSVDASGNNASQRIRTVNVVDPTPPPSCIIPDSGKWTINGNCMVDSSVTAPGDVLVQNHSTLTVPSGVTLDIDFTEFNLTVQYCSGVSVKSGGTVT